MVPGTVAVLLLIVLVTGVMLCKALSGGFMRQMLFQGVQVFLQQNAIGSNSAKTLGQLGLRPPGHENDPKNPPIIRGSANAHSGRGNPHSR